MCGRLRHVQQAPDRGYGPDRRGDPESSGQPGLACQRGVSETADPGGEWLTRPLVRKDGELVATTIESALERAAEGLGTALEDGGSDSVAVLGERQQTNEAAYALGKARPRRLRDPLLRRQHDAVYGLSCHRLLRRVRQ